VLVIETLDILSLRLASISYLLLFICYYF